MRTRSMLRCLTMRRRRASARDSQLTFGSGKRSSPKNFLRRFGFAAGAGPALLDGPAALFGLVWLRRSAS